MIVYRATAPSGRAYIGQTIQSLSARRKSHENKARNGSRNPFHCAIRKYGDKIKWEMLCRATSIAALNWIEPRYIAAQNTLLPHGYNAKTGGENGEHCAEARAKISAKMTGREFSPEHRAAISAKLKGRKLPPEHRAKIAAGNKGKTISPEHRAKLSAVHTGKVVSPDVRAAISAKLTGRKRSPETRAKISAAAKRNAIKRD